VNEGRVGKKTRIDLLDISNKSSRKYRTQRVEHQKDAIVDVTRVSS
jgi:hypothetical protein